MTEELIYVAIGACVGALLILVGVFVYLYRAMGAELAPTNTTASEHACDDTFSKVALPLPIPAPPPRPRPGADNFGEGLIFRAICDTPHLYTLYSAYASARDAQQRACKEDERMFYDAVLGATLRKIIDSQRGAHHTRPAADAGVVDYD